MFASSDWPGANSLRVAVKGVRGLSRVSKTVTLMLEGTPVMNQITVDSPLKMQLAELTQSVEVVDETGRSLGYFVPAQAAVISDDCPYSAEELALMRNAEGGRALADIWKLLESQ